MSDKNKRILICFLAAILMASGWSIRGGYGHSIGAMMPGAMLVLFLVIAAERPDWWNRVAIIGFMGAIGWGFGGQSSYGRLTGYTGIDSLPDVFYGYGSIFLVGAMWGLIGGMFLGLAFTLKRSQIEIFFKPLITIFVLWVILDWTGLTEYLFSLNEFYDTVWIKNSSALIVGILYWLFFPKLRKASELIILITTSWWIGLLLFAYVLDWHMTPPRSDSWAACLGVMTGLLIYLVRQKNHAAFMLAIYGFFFGGIGFATGDFLMMLQRAEAGPYRYGIIREHGGWGDMESVFGLIMDLGIALGVTKLIQNRITPPIEDDSSRNMSTLSVFFLLVIMMWKNFEANLSHWKTKENVNLTDKFLELPTEFWAFIVASCLSAIVAYALFQHRKKPLDIVPKSGLGKSQLLFLLVTWMITIGAFTNLLPHLKGIPAAISAVHFIVSSAICSIYIFSVRSTETNIDSNQYKDSTDPFWLFNRKQYLVMSVFIIIFLTAITFITLVSHEGPVGHSHFRFPK